MVTELGKELHPADDTLVLIGSSRGSASMCLGVVNTDHGTGSLEGILVICHMCSLA